jgi:hypothetical protein
LSCAIERETSRDDAEWVETLTQQRAATAREPIEQFDESLRNSRVERANLKFSSCRQRLPLAGDAAGAAPVTGARQYATEAVVLTGALDANGKRSESGNCLEMLTKGMAGQLH